MTMITRSVQWELGYESPVDPAFVEASGNRFGFDPAGGQYQDTLDAINTYILGLPNKVDALAAQDKISGARYRKFQELFQDWKKFYQVTNSSWYISDADINLAKKKRDDIQDVIDRATAEWARAHSAQAKGMTPQEAAARGDEAKTFWERHWLAITLGVAGAAALTYLGGGAIAAFKVAGHATGARALARALH